MNECEYNQHCIDMSNVRSSAERVFKLRRKRDFETIINRTWNLFEKDEDNQVTSEEFRSRLPDLNISVTLGKKVN